MYSLASLCVYIQPIHAHSCNRISRISITSMHMFIFFVFWCIVVIGFFKYLMDSLGLLWCRQVFIVSPSCLSKLIHGCSNLYCSNIPRMMWWVKKLCITVPCREGEFTCSDGRCIPEQLRCDGRTDCSDDEFDCPGESLKPALCSAQLVSPVVAPVWTTANLCLD